MQRAEGMQLQWEEDEVVTRVRPHFDGSSTVVMRAVAVQASDAEPVEPEPVEPEPLEHPEPPSPASRRASSTVVVRSRRRTPWAMLAATLLLTAVTTLLVLRDSAALHIELAEQGSTPKAEVFVDGQRRCEATPCIVERLSPGTHVVRIVADGGMSSEIHSARLEPWQTKRVTLSIPRAATGGLRASAAHRGISVTIDGKGAYELPLSLDELAPGNYTVRFDGGERFRSQQRKVVVEPGKTVDLGRVSLDLLEGELTVDVQTKHARVWLRPPVGAATPIDGPWPRTVTLSPGDYELVVARRGFRSVVRPIHIDATHAAQQVAVTLKPADWARDDIFEL